MPKNRELKIVKSFSSNPTALLPLKGRWLEQAGFNIGMRVQVIVREQCLVVLPVNPVDEAENVNRHISKPDNNE